jgi:hypothetical protein
MFFKKNGIKFHYKLFKACASTFQEVLPLYGMQKVDQKHINRDICTVSAEFALFCPTPAYHPVLLDVIALTEFLFLPK